MFSQMFNCKSTSTEVSRKSTMLSIPLNSLLNQNVVNKDLCDAIQNRQLNGNQITLHQMDDNQVVVSYCIRET